MTHVHRFGDVGRTEVDDDRSRLHNQRHAQPLVGHRPANRGGEGGILHADIDKSRTNRVAWRLEQRAVSRSRLQPANDLDRHVARLFPGPLGQCHRHRAGVVTKLGVGRLADLLEQPGHLVGRDRHAAVGRERLQRCAKRGSQCGPEVDPGRWAIVRHHRVAAPAAGTGTGTASLQRCSRSQYSRASASKRCTITLP